MNTYFKLKNIIFITILILIIIPVMSQNCKNYDKNCPLPSEKKFEKSAMSKTVKLRKKIRSTFNVTLYGGLEYYISVCGKSKLGDIQLRILGVDDQKIMFDNSAEGFMNSINIKSDLTQKLAIEVSAPSGKFDDKEAGCAGILIASRKMSK